MEDCIFCKIVRGDIPAYKVYEDENVLAFLDHTPSNPGHTLVIPKEHYDTFLAMPDDVVKNVVVAIKKIAPAVAKGIDASGFNLNLNNGKTAGQVVFHVHWHIVPRFENDGLKLWPGREYNEGEADEILEKIKREI